MKNQSSSYVSLPAGTLTKIDAAGDSAGMWIAINGMTQISFCGSFCYGGYGANLLLKNEKVLWKPDR